MSNNGTVNTCAILDYVARDHSYIVQQQRFVLRADVLARFAYEIVHVLEDRNLS